MKKVLLKPRISGGPSHSLYEEIITCPPEGFEIITDKDTESTSSGTARFAYKTDKRLQRSLIFGGLWNKSKSLMYLAYQRLIKSTSYTDIDLLYASQQLIFDPVPWVADLEFADAFVGYGDIQLCRSVVEKALSARHCKKIIPWSDWSKSTLFRSVDCKPFREKVQTVNLAVRPKTFAKKEKGDKIRLLFMGSTNPTNAFNFELKGGAEVLESFNQLTKRYDNLELVIRSWVPNDLLKRYSNNHSIKFCLVPLTKTKLTNLFASSDILVFPSHSNLGMTILDAMSYGLTVVALRVYDVPEAVQDMKTGILIEPSPAVPYYTWNGGPNHYDKRFYEAIRSSRPFLVKQLVTKLSALVESSSIRNRLSREGRKNVEHGKYSIQNRNYALKQIFEQAMS